MTKRNFRGGTAKTYNRQHILTTVEINGLFALAGWLGGRRYVQTDHRGKAITYWGGPVLMPVPHIDRGPGPCG